MPIDAYADPRQAEGVERSRLEGAKNNLLSEQRWAKAHPGRESEVRQDEQLSRREISNYSADLAKRYPSRSSRPQARARGRK